MECSARDRSKSLTTECARSGCQRSSSSPKMTHTSAWSAVAPSRARSASWQTLKCSNCERRTSLCRTWNLGASRRANRARTESTTRGCSAASMDQERYISRPSASFCSSIDWRVSKRLCIPASDEMCEATNPTSRDGGSAQADPAAPADAAGGAGSALHNSRIFGSAGLSSRALHAWIAASPSRPSLCRARARRKWPLAVLRTTRAASAHSAARAQFEVLRKHWARLRLRLSSSPVSPHSADSPHIEMPAQ
mmetsp:Transcript_17724/g.45326  ORF Transcript_17724/g.45326 Transcript_17724/m.45326 type:complete len:251 (+) Transcript_17724:931-1683(+)